jgi:hypothetical protein
MFRSSKYPAFVLPYIYHKIAAAVSLVWSNLNINGLGQDDARLGKLFLVSSE